MLLPVNNFLGFVIPGIIFLAFGISFLLMLLALLSVVKSFFQKRGRVVGGIIFNGIEEYAVVVINDKTNSIGNALSTLRMIGISEKWQLTLCSEFMKRELRSFGQEQEMKHCNMYKLSDKMDCDVL